MSDVKGNYAPLLPMLKDLKIDQLNLEFAYDETEDPGAQLLRKRMGGTRQKKSAS
jgi:hypothetical protein